jgi:hypothetical protein
VVAAIRERDPAPLKNASPEVWAVLKRALEKVPAQRHADAAELASALAAAAQAAGVPTPETSGAFPARASLADRSVPPAPFREQETTVRSTYVEAKRRRRTRATISAVTVAAALAAAAAIYVRSSQPVVEAPSSAAHAPAPSLDRAPLATAPVVSATIEVPQALPGAATVSVAPAPPPDPTASAAPHSRAPTHVGHPGGKPAAVSPAPSAPPRSTVVRDPGF